jgi:hypothetical protein
MEPKPHPSGRYSAQHDMVSRYLPASQTKVGKLESMNYAVAAKERKSDSQPEECSVYKLNKLSDPLPYFHSPVDLNPDATPSLRSQTPAST